MRRNLGKALSLALALAACGPTNPGHGNSPDASGGGGDAPGTVDSPTGNTDGCSDDAKLIYVIDENGTFSQFDPKTKTFNDLGPLNCPTTLGAAPFSMAVARDATAWVLYDKPVQGQNLYRVDTRNNLACTQSAWVGQSGLSKFGMGFSTDQVGGTTDTLFIAGSASLTDSTTKLNRLDLTSFQPTSVGPVTGWPELTGTGSAELWGFFPGAASRIAQLPKSNGPEIRTYNEPALNNPNPMDNTKTTAWAFAFHGGSFWVFLRKYGEDATTVYQVNSATGMIVGTTDTVNRSIVGAGVSTCAPVIIL